MSCCSGGYCQFTFPEGPPLLDNPVTNLNARYLFLPYGTLLQKGETVRIWLESGQAKTVLLEDKIELQFTENGPNAVEEVDFQLPWQLIAFDSGMDYDDLMHWSKHDLFNPEETSVVVVFNHPIEVKPTLKQRWLQFLYKMRNL
ncbi:hypothetical protein [Thiomicrorhabdus sediminis]|uniref:Uncharacterized protein n=1 Tax=Thiomicrorhabdus sediminis TaxID=2580412 RepID=A0A4P9K5U6_9GAMM|nr:hypothetical protein [Thiomicrorhabdus sediminis]QCU89646.1 hypothetical protein FE785_02835 [Thiomicrorhabdus sediminis]